jgi:XTP/dITP diphosphohydrolase
MATRLVIATKNAGKVAELRELLGALGFDVVSLCDLRGAPEIVEDADSFSGNALKKALAVAAAYRCASLADDSGLEVDALGGAPGVKSARYGGEGLSDAERSSLLLEALRDVPAPARTARFRCALAFVEPGAEARTFEGVFPGRISSAPPGRHGFGTTSASPRSPRTRSAA